MRLNGSSGPKDESTSHSPGSLHMSQTCHPGWADSGEPLRPGSQCLALKQGGNTVAVKFMTQYQLANSKTALQKFYHGPSMMVHAYNIYTQEAEAGG